MTPERWQAVKRVVQDALDRPPDARPGFVDAACAADPALRDEVVSLLAADAAGPGAVPGAPPLPDYFERPASATLVEAALGGAPRDAATGEAATGNEGTTDPAQHAALAAALADRFALDREIGRGGMAVVYRARDLRHDRAVALKVLRPDVSAVLGAARFRREIRLAAGLQHPHLVPVLDSGESAGHLWFAMPYVEGESLRHRLVREGRLPVAEAVQIAREAALALDYAHRQGTVHRDVKPENILLSDGQALVADFGIAKALDAADAGGAEGRTRTGFVLGTPAYMAPEQVTGGGAVDARADVYALGVVLYEMLAGARPDAAPVAPSVRRVRGEVPVRVERAIRTAVARDPAERFASAAAFAGALAAGASGGTRPAELAARHGFERTRRWWAAAGAGLAAVGFLAATAIVLARGVSPPDRATVQSGADLATAAAIPAESVVAVLTFDDRTGDPALARLAVQTSDDFADALTSVAGAQLVPRGAVIDAERDAPVGRSARLRAIARAVRAGTLVTGAIARGGARGDSVEVRASLVDAATGRTLATIDPVRESRAGIASAVGAVRDRVLGGVGILTNPNVSHAALGGRQPPRYAAYREWAAAFPYPGEQLPPEAELKRELDHLARSAALDSSFFLARIDSANIAVSLVKSFPNSWSPRREALEYQRLAAPLAALEHERDRFTPFESARLTYARAHLTGELPAQLEAFRALAAVDPGYYGLVLAATLANMNRPAEASRALRRANAPGRASAWGMGPRDHWWLTATLSHTLGRHAEELAAARIARRAHPGELFELLTEVRALAAMDSAVVLGARLDEAFSLAPGLYDDEHGSPYRHPGPLYAGEVFEEVASELRVHGRSDAARAVQERALAWYQGAPPVLASQSMVLLGDAVMLREVGRCDQARAALHRLMTVHVDSALPTWIITVVEPGKLGIRCGDRKAAERAVVALDRIERRFPLLGASVQAAVLVAMLGRRDEAVARLAAAISTWACPWQCVLDLHRNPDLARLRGYPPFEALLHPRE